METNTRATVQPGTYRLDPVHTTIRFTAYHLWGVKPVAGTFTLRSGVVVVAHDQRRSTVAAELDAASFHTDDPRRDRDVTGKFLHAAAHPTIAFRATATDSARLDGVLTVRGTESPLALEVGPPEPLDGGGWRCAATARVDRFAAGVTTGRGIVHRWLDVELTVVAVPAPVGCTGLRP
ncbi:YceI family protein [Spirilliplanes yamanashiensis]|uniref:Lipid/polyisoprenoid-binding YceI-like domain-containing protein n=1 Tax=Spirilliplanes yamanashiensis TaxID=42233 RepID=A0A8J3YB60_9ACTN|nr:YceI family protein [Spirilliplanes yamanashiensis]MDP9818859.1 polyisoprenoid-binding protein YceI [Spirilliplanes yamanashiensis]GIJ05313.1 hypothetical protein Sya03_46650 [Spirilliplanes yamanashiensis]